LGPAPPLNAPDAPAAAGGHDALDELDDDELLRQLEAEISDAQNFGLEES
jgi:hypothetical protein